MIPRWLPPAEVFRNLRATVGMLGDSRSMSRMRFLSTAERIGLIEQLPTPSTAEELARRINAVDVSLLNAVLDVGVAVGELRCRAGRYSVRGSRLRAMAARDGQALRASAAYFAEYHGAVYA